ncbi:MULTISPECIES: VWA domain-containing protein [unclassified Coleofasciculus]|uniref:VWA domain-containing protein n=1 Tax=unclassified Coleofasciculus TaxID=2692782 RepID=UPI00187E6392|nr:MULTISPECIES: VWA domain-containing protein [unclassified Coleofasciculus]MBE9129913.1 VWA domain-containing protein [Coleofasciculus sp. LEGE 07081]MBE9152345.1 VWA domain-containing protein [Coleofasciculus sp. LEGE 07092]
MLENRDYTIVIDKSGSMAAQDQQEGDSRWTLMQQCTLALARKCEEFDPDGITVYVFSNRFQRYDNVTSSHVEEIFRESQPHGSTNLTGLLQDAIANYFSRKSIGQTKSAGETIIIVTDGELRDRLSIADTIVKASQRMERDEELAILFVQVGNDSMVMRSLKSFDDQLEGIGAKFDIVDTITMEEMEDMPLTDVLLNAIVD